jgi:hypothetical protein
MIAEIRSMLLKGIKLHWSERKAWIGNWLINIASYICGSGSLELFLSNLWETGN